MWKKFDKHSAVYHTQSKIENFQFIVTLRTISSLLKVPKFEKISRTGLSGTTGATTSSEEEESADEEDHVEQVTIRWQEKILSRTEIEFYKEVENCTSAAQRGYHDWIKREYLDEERVRGKIFTYVQEDKFAAPEEAVPGSGDGHVQEPDDDPPEVMYVFADLSPDTLLFVVKWWSADGMLLIYPDFNEFEKSPYYLEIDTDYRHLYSYAVTNASKGRSIPLLDSLRLPKMPLMGTNLQGLFDMPPNRCSFSSILFEIKEAEGFEYDSIHVRYNFHLPGNLRLKDGSLIGSTHASKSSSSSTPPPGRLWRFGFCFQLTFICEEHFTFEEPVRATFEVISVDSWDRERNEGYCQLQIPINPGKVHRDLPCYRINYGLLEKIERFFIGGRRKFEFQEFNTGTDGFLNRYGARVTTTGTLRVVLSVLMQKCPDIAFRQKDRVRRSGMTLDDIMKAYQEARRRLEKTIVK